MTNKPGYQPAFPTDNPFYHNYLFSEKDLRRATIKWWQYPVLWFCTTYVQFTDGYVWYYKRLGGKYYFIESEPLAALAQSEKGEK